MKKPNLFDNTLKLSLFARSPSGNLPKWCYIATKKLTNAVRIGKKAKVTNRTDKWPRDFYQLHTRNEVKVSRIKSVLMWYCPLLEKGLPEFTPEAFSGSTFRKKFLQLEACMERNNEPEPERLLVPEDLEGYAKRFYRTMDLIRESEDPPMDRRMKWEQIPGLCQAMGDSIRKGQAVLKDWIDKDWKGGGCGIWKENWWHAHCDQMEAYTKWEYALANDEIGASIYFVWIILMTVKWTGWSGDMSEFFPGKKHWIRWMDCWLKKNGFHSVPDVLKKAAYGVDDLEELN